MSSLHHLLSFCKFFLYSSLSKIVLNFHNFLFTFLSFRLCVWFHKEKTCHLYAWSYEIFMNVYQYDMFLSLIHHITTALLSNLLSFPLSDMQIQLHVKKTIILEDVIFWMSLYSVLLIRDEKIKTKVWLSVNMSWQNYFALKQLKSGPNNILISWELQDFCRDLISENKVSILKLVTLIFMR